MIPFGKKKILLIMFLVVVGGYFALNLMKEESTPPIDSSGFYHSSNLKIPSALSVAPPASFAEIYKKVKPAVVNIATTKEIKRQRSSPWAMDPFFRDFFGPLPDRGTRQKEQHSLGTGFIINEEGDILTNNHVVEGADEIIVNLDDGRELEAKIIGRDERLDIAILRPTKKGSYPYAVLGNSDGLQVGDWVVAVGNPFGLGHTITAGIVSAKERVLGAGPYDDFIQTDASINPGNSGGPLFNTNGEVVGINAAIVAAGQGIGFAIPINMAKDVIPQLITKGTVSRGWLGVAVRDPKTEEAQKAGLEGHEGAYVAEMVPGSPADRAGIREGDLVLEFNGTKINNSHLLPALVAKVPPGGEARIVFLHEGKKFERTVALGSLDQPQTAMTQSGEEEAKKLLGMVVRDLSPSERQQVRGGIVVLSVEEGSPAEAVGIREGDLLVEINGRPLDSLEEFRNLLSSIKAGGVIRLGLARGPYMYYFAFRKE